MNSSPTSLHFHAHGLDEASEKLAPYLQVRYVQLERGPACFEGAITRLGSFVAGRYRGSRNKLERFDVPRGRMLAVLPRQGLARVGVTNLEANQVVFARGRQELVLFTDRECHTLFALLPDLDSETSNRTRILQLTEAQALAFDQSIEDVALMTDMITSWAQHEGVTTRSHSMVAARRNAAVRAREYIDRNLDRRLSLANVCHASYSSPRALEYGFRELFGVSPIVYLRCSRLSCVRGELFRAPRTHGIVTQLAMKWGFWHLSQFSKDYYELFGELPSTTLSRANTSVHELNGMRKTDSRKQALPAF